MASFAHSSEMLLQPRRNSAYG